MSRLDGRRIEALASHDNRRAGTRHKILLRILQLYCARNFSLHINPRADAAYFTTLSFDTFII